jgi:3-deoxy-D-manno-octulosonic-acid transferase
LDQIDEVYKLAKKHNIKTVKRSNNALASGYDILLGDSIGKMLIKEQLEFIKQYLILKYTA